MSSLVPGTPPLFIPSGVSVNDFALLIGAAMTAVSAAAASSKLLTAGLDVLTALNLVQTTGKPARIIIMPSAWSALLANPAAYFEAGMNSVLADPTAGTKLLQQLLALIGVGPKAAAADGASDLAAVPVLLSALGLMQSTASGYVPLPSQWVALAENPIAYLNTQLQALSSSCGAQAIADRARPAAAGRRLRVRSGPLTLTATPQGVLTVSLGRQTTVGAGVAVGAAASVTVDLVTPALTLDLLLAAPIAGQGLALNWNTDTGGLTLTLVPAGPGPAGFAPLELLPASTGYLATGGRGCAREPALDRARGRHHGRGAAAGADRPQRHEGARADRDRRRQSTQASSDFGRPSSTRWRGCSLPAVSAMAAASSIWAGSAACSTRFPAAASTGPTA